MFLLPTDGAIEPLRISPAIRAVAHHAITRARRHAAIEHDAGDARVIAGGRLRFERRFSGEIWFGQLHRPAEAGLHGRDLFGQLVTVERHAGFEAQHVARAQAARRQTVVVLREQRIPQAGAASAVTKSSKPSSPV